MLPPAMMLATKKRGGVGLAFSLLTAVVLLLTACTPAGPRALLEGERLVKEGRYGDAIEQLRKATALLPNNAQAWNHLGLARHLAGLPEANEAYRQALKINPNLASARFNLGCLWLELNQPKEAATQLGSYVILEPKDAEARMLLGAAQLRAGHTNEAEITFKEILATQGGQPEALNGQAITQVQRKRAREAAATLFTAIQIKPDYAPALLNLAVVNHSYLGNKQQALHYYHAYLAINPKPLFFDRAAQAARMLEAELARTVVPPPLVTNPPPPVPTNPPSTPPPVTNRVVSAPPKTNAAAPLVTLTNKAPAITNTTPTVGVANPRLPANPPPQTNAETAKVDALPPVKAEFLRYKYLNPAAPAPGDRQKALNLFQTGQKAQEDKRSADALMNYEAATKVDPAFFEAYARLGRVAMDAGDRGKALAAYEHALVINPQSGATRFNFALVLHQERYLVDAAGELEKYYLQNPNDANGRLFLANLYLLDLKSAAKARGHYLKLLELEPQHPQALAIREWLIKNP